MKTFQFIIVTIGLLLLSACNNNLNKLLPRKTGVWNIARYESYIEIDTFQNDFSVTDAGQFIFDEDGIGKLIGLNQISGTVDTFSFFWLYDKIGRAHV